MFFRFNLLLCSLFSMLYTNAAIAQSVNIGLPPVLNFSKNEYSAGTQVWDITQDDYGVVWFANNAGALAYNGMYWQLYRLENGTIARSITAGKNGRVYVGGQGEFGFFERNGQGVPAYHALEKLLPEHNGKFTDVWDIEIVDGIVFFRTDQQVFRYDGHIVDAMLPGDKPLFFMGQWNGKLVIQTDDTHLHQYNNGVMEPFGPVSFFDKGKISALLHWSPDTMLITTIRDGIFLQTANGVIPWKTQDDNFLKTNVIFSAQMLPDGKAALGTALNGLVTLDRSRRIFHHVNKKSGLQNNTVLSLFTARNGSLWLGLDNGIAWVDINSPFTTFFPDGELEGTGYAAGIFDGKIYFGTNTGLYGIDWKSYYAPSERSRFTPVANASGQVWSLTGLDGHLFMGHHEGAYLVKNMAAQKLSGKQGFWRFIQMSPQKIIAGNYNGFAEFGKIGNNWTFKKNLPGFTESSRLLARDQGAAIWMAHPYRGLYRAEFPDDGSLNVQYFDAQSGLPSHLGNNVFKIREDLIFTGPKGVFSFNYQTGNFEPNIKFNNLFNGATVLHLQEDQNGNIWFATTAEAGVLLVENKALEKSIRKLPVPELFQKFTDGFPFILPVDNQNLFVATDKGFIHLNPESYQARNTHISIVLHEIRLKGTGDSLLFAGPMAPLAEFQLGPGEHTLSFTYASPDYPQGQRVSYAHLLEGSDQQWSEWSSNHEITFHNLAPGTYTFKVKARSDTGAESNIISVQFYVAPPWYKSATAYLIYLAVLAGLIVAVIYRQQRRFEEEKTILTRSHQMKEEEHLRRAQESEEEINRLQKEKLEAEVKHKNQELASVTMHLVQKNEMLSNISTGLGRLRKSAHSQTEINKEIVRILKLLETDTDFDADWEHFSQNFDQVHIDFLKRLSERYANLSPSDYKMCAYLRMNLSSKKIASLMNISLRSVEAGRYRLRKRLDLDTKTNLTDFLIRF